MALTVATVLRSGGEYTTAHVARLAAQVRTFEPTASFVCLSDVKVPAPRRTLAFDWPGWWAKIELFRPELLTGPTVYLDLDTDVVGPLGGLVLDRFAMLSDFYRPHLPASGVMSWPDAAPREVFDAFVESPGPHMDACRTWERWGDQGFIASALAQPPARLGDEVVSYKVHVEGRGIPKRATVVAYHGKPKPWDIAK